MFAMIWNTAPGAFSGVTGGLGSFYEIGEPWAELLYVWIALLQIVIFVATAIVFLMWLHRAYRNLPALGATELGTTPGWAVGYFFIPFANLFKPFQVVREIWRESMPAPESQGNFGGGFAPSRTPALVGWWWVIWIIANIAMQSGEGALNKTETFEGMLLASRLLLAAHALFVLAAVLAILMVKRIDEMQETKFRQMWGTRPPPPPDSFDAYRTV